MVGVRGRRGTWGAQGGGGPGGPCPFESVSGLRSVRTTLSQELLKHSTMGVSYVSGERHKGTGRRWGSPVCPSAPLLVRHFARVAFMGIQAEWYRPWGCLGVRCGGVEECVGPQVPGELPSLRPESCGDQEDLEAACN